VIRSGLVQQRSDLSPFEGDGRALRIVFVVVVGVVDGGHDLVEVARQRCDLQFGSRQFDRQRRTDRLLLVGGHRRGWGGGHDSFVPRRPSNEPDAPPPDARLAAHSGGYGGPVTTARLPQTLVFGSDDQPGIRRLGRNRFRYEHESGEPVTADEKARIASLAIPPAWTNVWISADPSSHLQATGRDAKGRKQYRYHDEFTAARGAAKFDDLVEFASGLGRLRKVVQADLDAPTLDHDHIVAVLVRLLDITSLRVGNEVYAQTNQSYGLTTLRNQHVAIRGSVIRMRFRGKSAHDFDIKVEDKRLAKLVRRCQALPGQRLFQYIDDHGEIRQVGSTDVNDYIRRHGSDVGSAKTFRTWGASVMAGELLAEAATDDADLTPRTVNAALRMVAGHLGNTLAVCRSSYVHPVIVDRFLDGKLADLWTPPVGRSPAGLEPGERRLVRLLQEAC
jgi:DNA topoisomerase-1